MAVFHLLPAAKQRTIQETYKGYIRKIYVSFPLNIRIVPIIPQIRSIMPQLYKIIPWVYSKIISLIYGLIYSSFLEVGPICLNILCAFMLFHHKNESLSIKDTLILQKKNVSKYAYLLEGLYKPTYMPR